MSEYIELINPRTKSCKLLCNGEVIAEYAIEICDGCERMVKLDSFGYKSKLGEKMAWFCGACR